MGYVNSWTAWHQNRHWDLPFPCVTRHRLQVFPCLQVCGQVCCTHLCTYGIQEPHNTRHTYRRTQPGSRVQRMVTASLISLLEKFLARRTVSSIAALKGLLHSQRTLGCSWVCFFFPLKKKSARKSSRIL